MTTPSILLITPSLSDACSYYRGIGVLRYLSCSIHLPNEELSWGNLARYSLLFFQRPFSTGQLEWARTGKQAGLPIWLDFDDHVFDVPLSNPGYRLMMKKEVIEVIDQIVALADVVTLSTPTLAKVFTARFGQDAKFQVIPNAHNDFLFPPEALSPHSLSKTVFWRGTATHAADLWAFSKEIIEVATAHPDWQFVFAGYYPYQLNGQMEFNYVKGGELLKYFGFLHRLRPAITIVPLQDNSFNRCKSNIAWMESAVFGGTAIVPNWPEWHGVSSVPDWPEWHSISSYIYDDPQGFQLALESAIQDGEGYQEASTTPVPVLSNTKNLWEATLQGLLK